MKIEDLDAILRDRKFRTKRVSAKRLVVYTSGSRQELMAQLGNEFGGVFCPNPDSYSTAGSTDYGFFKLYAKPDKGAGAKAAGIDNEDLLVKALNRYTTDYKKITVTFEALNVKINVANVKFARHSGADTKGRKKADVVLETSSGEVPISVKKDKAEMWESADSYWSANTGMVINHLLKKGEITMEPNKNVYKIKPSVAIEATSEEKRDVVFGSDLLGKGFVAQKSYSESDFSFNLKAKELKINCTHLIQSEEDVHGDHDVWFLIRPDATRRSVKEWPGVRTLAVYQTRLTSGVRRYERSVFNGCKPKSGNQKRN
ncbi:hypothetical protein CPT_Mendera_049 [Stenotrophomonas phage Mendera]|uniref:Uncharacterized protein n=1 Tax=Stenotrophomonas phage Mendera TaxID=2650877 RepID=A0A5P8PIN9_9CAUD|nr:hypothetical protein HWC60_gp049 [Stenotrophomonas phage Mendera]QFR56598.1 hypothetical protein CPT_Mendera_049 [Stenotrophomonas phage Mendera]